MRRIGLLLLILVGGSGLLVGLELLPAESAVAAEGPADVAIPVGIALYGVAAILAGVGVLARRRWGRRLGLAAIALGLVELVWQTTLIGLDSVTLLGVAVWALLLVLLVALGRGPASTGTSGRT